MRGPTSTGRLVMKPKLVAGSRVMPKGLYGLSACTMIVSAMPPVPANGPTKIGSGAAWLVEVRLLYRPLMCSRVFSVRSYETLVKIDLRFCGVSSRLYGAKLKRSALPNGWNVPPLRLSGSNTGVVVPSLSVMSYQLLPSASHPPTPSTGREGSQKVKRPCGMPELPASTPVPGVGKADCSHTAELISSCSK